jgi:hypothetical protein
VGPQCGLKLDSPVLGLCKDFGKETIKNTNIKS